MRQELRSFHKNTITIAPKAVEEVYRWACRLTSEQGLEEYLWTSETRALAQRLQVSKGNMIAVTVLQRSGSNSESQVRIPHPP